MMHLAALPFLMGLTQIPASPLLEPLDKAFESALGVAGLSTRNARFDDGLMRLFRSGEFTAPLYLTLSANPWGAPQLLDAYRRGFIGFAGKPSESLILAGAMAGFGTRRTLLGNPIDDAITAAQKPGSLAATLEKFRADGLTAEATPKLDAIPKEVQQAAALVLQTALDSVDFRRMALQNAGDAKLLYQRLAAKTDDELSEREFDERLAIYRNVNLKYMMAAAHDVTLAATTAAEWVQGVDPKLNYDVSFKTIWGTVRLCGGSNTKHDGIASLLIIDTGGDDTYINVPANASYANWLSVCIDTAGNDKYLSHDELASKPIAEWPKRKPSGLAPGPGGALLGFVCLIDTAGDDLYRSHRPGIGSGRIGSAVVLDKAGNDTYDTYVDSIGFGNFGIGIVEDLIGNDQYSGFQQVQGCGQTAGVGLLIDRAGNDIYDANDKQIDFPSPQSKDHNVSMAQGSGNGRRADYSDGQSLSGGIGILLDQQGSDTYHCGVFGQGVGYWAGVGCLWDCSGDDQYLGQWYVQGASAHFAIGYLEDLEGDDHYTALMNMAQGAGHDFSVGTLIDRAGKDTYKAPNLSLGAGNANGIGIFVDCLGDDSYECSGITLGKAAGATAGTTRERAFSLGLFIDRKGSNSFPAALDWARNGETVVNWAERMPLPEQSQLGIFMSTSGAP